MQAQAHDPPLWQRAALALPLAALAASIARFNFLCDDAYIAFRYSKNFAAGLGLRYNAGVEPPVEGYTQLGWVLWGALLETLGLEITTWARVSSVACAVALYFCVLRFARRRLELGLGGAFAAGTFLALLPSFGLWSTGGLGTMPFALAIFLCFDRLLGDPERVRLASAAPLCALVCAMRADGAYWVAALLALGALRAVRGRRELWRALLVCAGTAGLTLALIALWRWSYYADWVPNTARAKVGLSRATTLERGALYAASYLVSFPSALIALGAGAMLALRPGSATLRASWCMAAATLLYGVLAGGDFMAMGRFFTPAAPFLALLFAGLVVAIARNISTGVAAGVGALVLASSAAVFAGHFVAPLRLRAPLHFRWTRASYIDELTFWENAVRRSEMWARLGHALALHTHPSESLVFPTIGAVGFHSGLFIHDQHGLTSRLVTSAPLDGQKRSTPGHDRFVEPEFFRSERPTYWGAYFLSGDAQPGPSPEGGRPRIVPLSREDGFRPGDKLVLVRNTDA